MGAAPAREPRRPPAEVFNVVRVFTTDGLYTDPVVQWPGASAEAAAAAKPVGDGVVEEATGITVPAVRVTKYAGATPPEAGAEALEAK